MIANKFFIRLFRLVFLFLLSGISLFCFSEHPPRASQILTNLLLVAEQVGQGSNDKEETGDNPSHFYTINSVTPKVLMENTNFVLEGKLLGSLSAIQLLGEGGYKYAQILEQSDSQILLHLQFCPKSELIFLKSNDPEVKEKIVLPCFGNFRYPLRNLVLNWMETIDPVSPLEPNQYIDSLRALGEIEFAMEPTLPMGLRLNQITGALFGTPAETTNDEFQTFQITARLKEDPSIYIQSHLSLIVLTPEERENRKCRSISSTSTCRFPSPYTCSKANLCFSGQLSCLMDLRCGL